jgi:hypothetical protein
MKRRALAIVSRRQRCGSLATSHAFQSLAMDLFGMTHALTVLAGFPLVALVDRSTLPIATRSWFSGPGSAGVSAICVLSCVYFAVDLALHIATTLWYRGFALLDRRDFGVVVHHATWLLGLSGPLLTGKDGRILLGCLWLSEASNPPRLLSQLISQLSRHERRSGGSSDSDSTSSAGGAGSVSFDWVIAAANQWLAHFDFWEILRDVERRQRVIDSLLLLHVVEFIVARVVTVHYAAHVVFPLSQLQSTTVSTFGLVGLTVLAVWEFATLKNTATRLGETFL